MGEWCRMEFNRFAEYYRNRAEIDIPTNRGERAGRGDRKKGGFEKRSEPLRASTVCSSTWVRRTVSSPSDLIGLLNSNTRGRIELDVST